MQQIKGQSITPCLKEAMVYLAQSELYTEAPAVLKLLTGVEQSQASFWRLAQDCGAQLEPLLAKAPASQPPADDQIVYCMADGSMLSTDDGWQEVKVGRVFSELPRQEELANGPLLATSQYVAHLGDHQDFATKMDVIVNHYAALGKRVVCLGDGAIWLKHYWQHSLPQAQMIGAAPAWISGT